MVFSLRVSWICLLLVSSGACAPAAKGDYRYPYSMTWSSSGGSAPASNPSSEGLRRPLVNLQHEASSPTGNQLPSNVAAGSAPSYEPTSFVNYGSSSGIPSRAPEVPSHNAGYVSSPGGSGERMPSFPVQPQPNMGSNVATSSPVFFPFLPYSADPVGNAAATSNVGDGSVYANAPATSNMGDGSVYANAPATSNMGDGSVYANAPATSNFGYGSPGLPWDFLGGPDTSLYDLSNWMPSGPSPDVSVFSSGAGGVSETSPLPPSSYIVQSRNGYARSREISSHSQYIPEYPEPPASASRAPSKDPAVTGSKGGHKG